MKANAKAIIYDPFIIDDLARITKEGSKFNSIHILKFKINSNTNLTDELSEISNKIFEINRIKDNKKIILFSDKVQNKELIKKIINKVLEIDVIYLNIK